MRYTNVNSVLLTSVSQAPYQGLLAGSGARGIPPPTAWTSLLRSVSELSSDHRHWQSFLSMGLNVGSHASASVTLWTRSARQNLRDFPKSSSNFLCIVGLPRQTLSSSRLSPWEALPPPPLFCFSPLASILAAVSFELSFAFLSRWEEGAV